MEYSFFVACGVDSLEVVRTQVARARGVAAVARVGSVMLKDFDKSISSVNLMGVPALLNLVKADLADLGVCERRVLHHLQRKVFDEFIEKRKRRGQKLNNIRS
jgi:hypothetical protein